MPDTIDHIRQRWAAQLKAHRDRLGLTQETVAAEIGVAQETYSAWERGLFAPSDTNRPKLARLYGVPVAELFSYPDGDAA